MLEGRLQGLRKQQVIYSNLLWVVYLAIPLSLAIWGATAPVVYSVLGVLMLVSPFWLLVLKRPNPLLLLFPGMKELARYEEEKLGEHWRRYNLSGLFLSIALSIFFFVQAVMRNGNDPFIVGIPFWYLLAVPVLVLWVANINLRFHSRRIDQKTTEQLQAYADDRILLSIIFASVLSVFAVVGALVYSVLSTIHPA